MHQNTNSLGYVIEGLRLLLRPELRRFVLIPILINAVLFIGLNIYLFGHMDELSAWAISFLPEWEWLRVGLGWIIKIIAVISILILSAYSFNFVASLIAAPFNGLLAERAEELLTGERPPEEPLSSMIPRTLGRELKKLSYFIPRAIGVFFICFMIGLIPVVGLIAPILAFTWAAWSLCIQYVDYCFDNHQVSFDQMLSELSNRKPKSYGFGCSIAVIMLVPFVNLVIMPAAVVGGTVYWSKIKRDVIR